MQTRPAAPADDPQDAAAQLARLQESLGIVTWVWDLADGRTQWFGDLSPLVGWPAGSYRGTFEDWLRCVHPEDAERSRLRFRACMKGELPEYRVEERVRWPDGQVRWLETCGRGLYGADGRALSLVGVVRDISDRKAAERAAARGEQRLQTLVDNAPVAIGMSVGDRVTYGNPAFLRMFGVTDLAQVVGRPVTDLVSPASRADFTERSARREAREPVESDYVIQARRLDGREFACQVSVAGALFADGAATLVFLQDVSERRRAEQAIRELNAGLERRVAERTRELEASNAALAEARDAAEAATRAKGEFLANMSHEIRTPMNAVLGLADLGLRVPGLPPRAEHYLRNLRQAGESLLGILNDILDFSKIESGKLVVERGEFSLDEVLDRLAAMMAPKAAEKGLEFLLGAARDAPRRLVGDPLRLGQVLLNLCSNAVKFTERGEVVVLVARAPAPAGGRTALRFVVRDSGAGIAPEQMGRLFTAFDQIDRSITRRHGGTGLGLAICRQLVQLMGGEIGARSQPGQGSEFFFTLPFELPAGAAEAEAAAVPARRVLVVDDSESAREILADLLAALGCRFALAAGADEALAQLAAAAAAGDPFDAVLLDWRMPQVDGFAAAARVRALALAPPPRLVLLSAYGDDAVAARARREGFAACLAKPVTVASLRQALAPPSEAEARAAAAPAVAPAVIAGRRILLAEDNELNQMVAVDLLGGVAGARVTVARDGHEAVEQVRQADFDLVLMDVQMPGLDGFEATRRIRRLPRGALLPVLAMTAHALPRERELARAAGMDDFITKPFDAGELFTLVAKWLAPPTAPAPEPPAPAGSGVDFALGLRRCGGLGELQRKVVGRFLETRAGDAAELRRAFESGAADQVLALAHRLVSSAGMIGAQTLSDLARALQDAAGRGLDADADAGLVEDFAAEHARVLADLRRHLGAG